MSDKEEQKQYKLSDDAIIMIRELLQLCLLTNTNLVDNYRALRFSVDETGTYLVPSEAYMKSYNEMIEGLNSKLQELEKLHIQQSVPVSKNN